MADRSRLTGHQLTLSALVSIRAVLVDDFSGYEWAARTVGVLRTIGGMILGVATAAFILDEGTGLTVMLARWLTDKIAKDASEKERRGILEADRDRREGESLEDAVRRREEAQRPANR